MSLRMWIRLIDSTLFATVKFRVFYNFNDNEEIRAFSECVDLIYRKSFVPCNSRILHILCYAWVF